MADPRVSRAVRRSSPSSGAAEDFRLEALIRLAREVGGDVGRIHEYANLIDDRKRLERALKEKSREVTKLNRELAQHNAAAARDGGSLAQTFCEQYMMYDRKKAALDDYLARMEHAREADACRRAQLPPTPEAAAASAVAEHDPLRKRADASHVSQAEEAGLNHQLLHIVDEARAAHLRENLQSLSALARGIVNEFIADPEVTTRSVASLQTLQTKFPAIPLSNGATQEAVLMRRAAGQAVISEALMTHIFRPFYVQDDLKDVADQMLEFLRGDREKHQAFRCRVIQSLDRKEVEMAAGVAAREASAFVSRFLDRLMPREDVGPFRREVEGLSRQAARLWFREAQRAIGVVEVRVPLPADEQVESCPQFGARGVGEGGMADREIAAVLFPRVAIDEKLLHGGEVLWSDAEATVLARSDYKLDEGTGWHTHEEWMS